MAAQTQTEAREGMLAFAADRPGTRAAGLADLAICASTDATIGPLETMFDVSAVFFTSNSERAIFEQHLFNLITTHPAY